MWNSIVDFLASVIDIFYNWTGNFGVAVIIFTIIVKGLLLPLDIKSRISTSKIQDLQPEIQRISDKYKNDPEKRSRKLQELYAQNNVSPMSGCLPMLITLPVIFILFAALRKIAAEHMYIYMEQLLIANDASMKDFLAQISASVASSDVIKTSFQDILPMLFNNSGNLPSSLAKLPEVISQESFDLLSAAIKSVTFEQAQAAAAASGYSFLWIKNIWVADSAMKSVLGTSVSFGSAMCNGWFILPVLSTATQYLQTFLMTHTNKKKSDSTKKQQDPTANSMNWMNKLLPLMSLYFCAVYNSAFAIYWTVSNIISITQNLVMNLIKKMKDKKSKEEVVNL